MEGRLSTAIATPNIALVKYWGNRNDRLNLPYNSSVSVTLDESLSTRTSVLFSGMLRTDVLYVNDKLQDIGPASKSKNARLGRMLTMMRKSAGVEEHALVVTRNSFPASSGLASSAAGGAAFVHAAADALGLNISFREQSILARRISGSACRSLFGGFVVWYAGWRRDGTDSYAWRMEDENYWKEIRDVIAIVDPAEKKVSSSAGHVLTPKTSMLFKARPRIAESMTLRMVDAIRARDFNEAAYITMRDSDNMHAVMLDSWPPIIYLTDVSRKLMEMVIEMNRSHGTNIAAYTFDAGPNAHLITTEGYVSELLRSIGEVEGVKEVIVAGLGGGPRLLEKSESLIDESAIEKLVS